MSRPENPLARYRTYSYHQFLIACENTTTAQILAKSATFSDVTIFKERSLRRGDITKIITGTVNGVSVQGRYVPIINTMVDADFIIESVRWSSIFTPNSRESNSNLNAEQFTAFTIEGTMEIKEPQGIQFINTLNTAFDALQVDPAGVVFMLKTVFVGYNDNGFTETLYNIDPFLFILVDLTGYFDVTGAGYTISFVGVENGVTRLPQVAKVAQGLSITPQETGQRPTLEYVMNYLQQRINEAYNKYADGLKDSMAKQGIDIFTPGKRVGYIIKLNEPYIFSNYIIDLQSTDKKEKGTAAEAGSISLGKDVDIEHAINTIMRKCGKVISDMQPDTAQKNARFAYRISSALESGPAARAAYQNIVDAEYYYVYTVTQYKIITASNERTQDGEGCEGTNGNSMQFDYFFTGKNVDILEFDLKMQMGLSFLYTIATTNNKPQTPEDVLRGKPGNVTTAPGSGQTRADRKPAAIRNNTPIMFSSNSRDSLIRNSKRISDVTNFQALLSRFASLEGLEAKMTIMGNPRLLANTTRSAFTITPNDVQEGDVLLNWNSQPGLIKVNIRFPTPKASRNNPEDDVNEEYDDFSEQFWYKGCYYVMSVEHIFESGEFKQVLDMMSIPVDPFYEAPDSTEKEEQGTVNPADRVPDAVSTPDNIARLEASRRQFNAGVNTAGTN